MKNKIKRFDLAQVWIKEAGQRALFYYNKSLDFSYKKDGSVVTKADLEIEQFLKKKIELHFPDDNIIGEEFEYRQSTKAKYTWTIDPIDGTFSFAHKLPLFGNLIGLMEDNYPIMGLIYCPTLKEAIFTLEGHKSIWIKDDIQQNFSSTYNEDLRNCIISSSGLELIKTKKTKRFYANLLNHVKFERSFGDCYGHLLVATGRIDFMFDPKLKIWDYVPLIPNLRAAGAELITINTYKDKSIAAVSCSLGHQEFINNLQKLSLKNPIKF